MDLDQLARQYAVKAYFITIYTREAHPAGGWEVQRNKDLQLEIPAHKHEDDRTAQAMQMRKQTGLSTPIAVDTMDDKVATEYGGFTTAAVIVGRDGTIVGFRRHADAHAIKRMLDDIAAGG